ncbi:MULTISPECIES: DsbE family thiol:disulfide interchange protein [unclassified Bosea (in: a-proteobacteria)]|uniref:DsbE family thiol:disulfide interchange protein n=1 Tax=unclassified Bosea (in: a-proteobacteria) TaxID=2653178 RepID=UPI0009565992|nr:MULTISPECIES: DsbE family thiol:disulfide interchange protein [unclassified Bosea (in: a-proteobacteria)]TAJ28204.1 MAG: DsbE family thiol:disulfide interchange protein [Bosea sp. (in: a-proteobacteria)]SIR38434.1 cytochrome c biogenesis protein CcmG, thiol:disulfide interchange protein DsbE [Bosea sp. TND4EK4]
MSAAGPDTEDGQPRRRSPLIYLVPLILFAGLSIIFGVGLFSGDTSRVPSALIGRVAPAVALAPVEGLARDGQAVPAFGNADLAKGRATIVNVFASWCAPCKVEHPVLMGIAQSEAVSQGKVALVGLNYKDEAENARRFLGALGNPFSAVGADKAGRSAIEWGVYGVPETFVIGPDGRILDKHVGPLDQAAASKLLQRALKGS